MTKKRIQYSQLYFLPICGCAICQIKNIYTFIYLALYFRVHNQVDNQVSMTFCSKVVACTSTDFVQKRFLAVLANFAYRNWPLTYQKVLSLEFRLKRKCLDVEKTCRSLGMDKQCLRKPCRKDWKSNSRTRRNYRRKSHYKGD